MREGHLAHTHREPLRTSLGTCPERYLLDVRSDPVGDAEGVATLGVKEDDRNGRGELADQVGGPHELGNLLRERSFDLGADRFAIAGKVRAQHADRKEVLVSRRTSRLASQQVAEAVLMKYPGLGIHELAHVSLPSCVGLNDPTSRPAGAAPRGLVSKSCATETSPLLGAP